LFGCAREFLTEFGMVDGRVDFITAAYPLANKVICLLYALAGLDPSTKDISP
jgi:hypothetical protein